MLQLKLALTAIAVPAGIWQLWQAHGRLQIVFVVLGALALAWLLFVVTLSVLDHRRRHPRLTPALAAQAAASRHRAQSLRH